MSDLTNILKQKGYRFFRNAPFIDREEEIEFLINRFEETPQRILFLYGPKSTGKTTLIEYVIENELIDDKKLFKSSKYNIKYVNFRGKLIASYNTFLDSVITRKNVKLDEKLSASINLGVFKLNTEIFEAIKQKEIDIFDALTDEFKKSKKKNIFIIDEIQILEDIYINGNRELLKEFLNFCVRLTKEIHLSHVVILTSNTIFLNRIYNDSKLKATSIFKLIDHPEEEISRKLLEDLGYDKKEIDLIIDYLGSAFTYLMKLAQFVKPNEDIDKLKEYLEAEKLDAYMQIDEILTNTKKYGLETFIDDKFIQIAKEIIQNGYFDYKTKSRAKKQELINIIEVFSKKEILFFDPQTGIVTPNSRIYLKAMEDI